MRGSWSSPRPIWGSPCFTNQTKPIKPRAGLWLRGELLAHQAREGKKNSTEREKQKHPGPGGCISVLQPRGSCCLCHPQAVPGILVSGGEMRYKGSAPFQAFLHSSQGGGVRVRAPEGKDQRRESCATDGEGHKSPGFQDCPHFKYSGLSDHISLFLAKIWSLEKRERLRKDQ